MFEYLFASYGTLGMSLLFPSFCMCEMDCPCRAVKLNELIGEDMHFNPRFVDKQQVNPTEFTEWKALRIQDRCGP